jgi:hypothetical protein
LLDFQEQDFTVTKLNICDFGISSDMNFYRTNPENWRWLAPESFKKLEIEWTKADGEANISIK